MSTRLQHNMDKKAPVQRLSSLSPVALVVMGLVGAADALASVRESLMQSHVASDVTLSAKTTVLDYNAVASLVQALVREGFAPEEAALQVQFALQGPNPLAALSALVASVSQSAGAETAQDTVSLPTLVEVLNEQLAQLAESGQTFDAAMLQEVVPSSAGFAQADLALAMETFKSLEQGVGAAQRGGNAEVAQNQIDMLLAQATQAGATVATDAGAATTATASGAASGAAAMGAMSAAQAIALIGFAAVAGGAFSSDSTVTPSTNNNSNSSGGSTTTEDSSSGNVIDGPIYKATVFRDLNGNYIQDAGEYSTTTDAVGGYKLLGKGGTIVATGGTDTETNLAFTGILAAPSTAKVVTPLTTLLAVNPDLSVAELKASLGLTVDPFTFNPYATGADAAAAAATQKAAAQVLNVLTNLAVVLKNAGADSASGLSLSAAFKEVAYQVASKLESQANSSATPINLADATVLGQLGASIQTVATSKGFSVADDIISSFKSTVAASNQTIKDVVGTDLKNIGNAVKTAQQATIDLNNNKAPTVSNPIADITVNEDSPLSGGSGSGGSVINTLPGAFEANNIGLANLRSLFAGDTNAAAPTLKMNLDGYAIKDDGNSSSVDITVSLQKPGFGDKALSIVFNDVLIDASTSGKTLTLPTQNLSASLKIGNFEVGAVTLSNLDADQLLLVDGNNTIGASPSFVLKLQSLVSKLDHYGGTGILDLASLSAKQSAALVGAFILSNLEDTSTAGVVAKLKSLINLPSTADTVSEMVSVIQRVIDFPAVSSLKVADIKAQISSAATVNLLNLAESRTGILDTDTLSTALSKLSANLGTYKLSQIADLLSNGTGIDSGVNLMSLAKDLVSAALSTAPGLTGQDIVTKISEALVNAYNNDALSLLDSLNFYAIAGTSNADMAKLLLDAKSNTLHYKDLFSLMANSVLSSDATLKVKVDGFSSTLSVTKDAAPVSSLEVSVPLTANNTYTVASSGFVIPANTFVDPDTLDKLAYTATLADGKPLPKWLTFDPLTRSFSGTPANDDVGTLTLKVTAQDPAGNKISDEFKITVNNTNDAPQLLTGASTTLSVVELNQATFDITKAFTDVDAGDALKLKYSLASALPTGWSFDEDMGVLSVNAPLNSTEGNLTQTIKITATDGKGGAFTQDFITQVTNDKTPPANLKPSLFEDNGTNSSDGISGNGRIAITSALLETGAKWFSNVKGTVVEQTGKTYFDLPVDDYAADDVKVYQQDQAGNYSTPTSIGKAIKIVAAPGAPTISIPDNGISTSDGITSNKTVTVILTDSATTWAYSLKGAAYVNGSGNSFDLLDGVTYSVGDIHVKQYNAAGIGGTLEATNNSTVIVDRTAPTVAISLDSVDQTSGVLTLKFAFSESVSGFTVDDVGFSGAVATGAVSGSGSNYTLLATPNSSTTATAMTVSVAASVATDVAGNNNSAATNLVKYVLYGTANADSLTGGMNADLVFAKDGNDIITGGGGADKIYLGAGNDTLVYSLPSDSSVSAPDTIQGFQGYTIGGDRIDLSQVLDYTSLAQYTFSASSPLLLTNWRADPDQVEHPGGFLVDLVAKDALFATATQIKQMTISVDFAATDISAFYGAYFNTGKFPLTTAGADIGSPSDFGSIVLAKESTSNFSGAISAGTVLATVGFTPKVASNFNLYIKDIGFAVGSDISAPNLPLPISSSGVTSGALTGYLSPIFETTETTVGDNQLHVIYNKTTGSVDIKFDKNIAAGQTDVVSADTIHLEGITGLDLTKNDFIFV